mmetsp:Transcript_111951/g.194373  ORF Transcript_111951/g.194373 Transcript_111951/m.194373 type:complete len:234 (-) Transcript_111951:341-1042(-)
MVGIQTLQVVEGRLFYVKLLHKMLVETAENNLAVDVDLPLGGLQLTCNHFHQGGLPRPISANERNAAVKIHAKVEIPKKVFLPFVLEPRLFHFNDWEPRTLGVGELELDIVVLWRWVRGRQPSGLHRRLVIRIVAFSAALGLRFGTLRRLAVLTRLCCRLVCPKNFHLPLVFLPQYFQLLTISLDKVVIRSGIRVLRCIIVQPLTVNVDDVGADSVQDLLVMGHDQDGPFPLL